MDRTDVKRRQVLEVLGDPRRMSSSSGLTVAAVMTAAPTCICPNTTALEMVELFHDKQFRHPLVTDAAGRLVGVLSDRDVLRCLGPQRHPDRSVLEGITAEQIMSTDLVTIGPSTTLERAVALMIDQGISCLPVLAEGALVGIVTNTDLHVVLQLLLQTLRQSSSEESLSAVVSSPKN